VRLDQRDSNVRHFESRVSELRNGPDGAWARLEASAFYPTSGGQPHDLGTLTGARGDARVEDVRIDDGAVWHRIAGAPLDVGERVRGEIDWPRRQRHMRRHSGQHLLSQAFVRLDPAFETRSVGLRSPVCTLDLAGDPDAGALRNAEALVHEVAASNLPIEAFEVDESELGAYALRRPPKVSGRIRLVRMGDFELSACGGTHLRATAEALPIKIVARERVKGGLIRVGFQVGAEAFEDYRRKHDVASALAAELSSRVEELPERVTALRADLTELRRLLAAELRRAVAAEAERLRATARPLASGGGLVVHLLDAESDPLALAQALIAHPGTVALLASATGERGRLLFARSDDLDLDVRPLLDSALTVIDGRGGGRAELAQGAGRVEGLRGALDAAVAALRSEG
jgi:alanyl-tRNA synthetase